MTKLARVREHVDVVIMDPPRDGSTKAFIDAIKYLGARKVVYVSCNPDTLKRDLYIFLDNGYEIKSIEGVDMFPRTLHVECVAVLELSNNPKKTPKKQRVIDDDDDDEELLVLQEMVKKYGTPDPNNKDNKNYHKFHKIKKNKK